MAANNDEETSMAVIKASGPPEMHRYTDSVDVIVGKGDKSSCFVVHSTVINSCSTFFASALSGRWEDGLDEVNLPEDQPFLFNHYLQCVYQNDARIPADYNLPSDGSKGGVIFYWYAKLYVLADKLGDSKTFNMIVDTLIDAGDAESGLRLDAEILQYVYDSTTQTSPLRQFRVAFGTHFLASRVWESDSAEEIPHEYLREVLAAKTRNDEKTKRPSSLTEDYSFISKNKELYHR